MMFESVAGQDLTSGTLYFTRSKGLSLTTTVLMQAPLDEVCCSIVKTAREIQRKQQLLHQLVNCAAQQGYAQ